MPVSRVSGPWSLLGSIVMWLALAAVVVLVDLYVVFQAMRAFGPCPTVIVLVLVGMIGGHLVRLSGLNMIRSFQESIARGEPPPEGVLEGLLLLTAGICFALPGVLTDVLAFALLVPPIRRAIARRLRARLERGIARGTVRVVRIDSVRPTSYASPIDVGRAQPNVIDVEGSDVTDDPRRLPP